MAAYAAGSRPPWDSGIVPPEVRALVEGPEPLPPGRALDVGCGTGVSAVYLARHGWQVTGVEWIAAALDRARERARGAGLKEPAIRFVQGDVTRDDWLADMLPVALWLDIGCLHGLSAEGQATYAAHAARLVEPGGALRLYAWRRHQRDGQAIGLDSEHLEALFGPYFSLADVLLSDDRAGDHVRPTAWYWLRRLQHTP